MFSPKKIGEGLNWHRVYGLTLWPLLERLSEKGKSSKKMDEKREVSHEKKTSYFPFKTGWSIGILIMVYCNAYITG